MAFAVHRVESTTAEGKLRVMATDPISGQVPADRYHQR
jgi:hypothetical protein